MVKKNSNKLWTKYIICTLLLCTICVFTSACSKQEKLVLPNIKSAETPLSIMVATDFHYLSPKLYNDSSFFKDMMEKADGKVSIYGEEITDAFLEEVSNLKPDALIISGDLTFNGEEQSHIDLVKKLEKLHQSGVPVLVIPGNHDINYPFSYSYDGDSYKRTKNISQKQFTEIYKNLGWANALSKDKKSYSYIYPLAEDVWFLFLDANTPDKPDTISDDTLKWAEEQLQSAHKKNIKVITVTHQNVLIHNEMFKAGFSLDNYEQVSDLLCKYDVPLNLSGHIHAQHISKKESLYDIASSSLTVFPNQYGKLEIDDKRNISYNTQTVDVSTYAKKTNIKDENLLNFAQFSKDYFDECTRTKIEESLNELDLSSEQKKQILEFSISANRNYYAGTLHENKFLFEDKETIQLLESVEDQILFSKYIGSLLTETPKNQNSLFISN